MTMISFRVVLLLQDGFQAAFNKPAAVVGHNRDGYEVVMRHAVFDRGLIETASLVLLRDGLLHPGCTPALTRHAGTARPARLLYYIPTYRLAAARPGIIPRESFAECQSQHYPQRQQRIGRQAGKCFDGVPQKATIPE